MLVNTLSEVKLNSVDRKANVARTQDKLKNNLACKKKKNKKKSENLTRVKKIQVKCQLCKARKNKHFFYYWTNAYKRKILSQK